MKYKIDAIERKTTSTGKEMAKLSIITEEGEMIQGVSIWADYPGFKDFKVEDTIEGDYKENGQWKNLYPPKPAPAAGGGAMRGVAAAQERKQGMIEKSQDRKEIGIKTSQTMRDVTLITLEALKGQPFPEREDFEREFKANRSMYLKLWDDTEAMVDKAF